MKLNNLLWLLAVALFSSVMAQAGSTVCAGRTLHYSLFRVDRGTPPPVGTYVGEEFLSVKGDLLGEREFYVGQTPKGSWNLEFSVTEKKALFHSGNPTAGSEVYAAKLSVTNSSGKTLEEPVTCKDTWAMVP